MQRVGEVKSKLRDLRNDRGYRVAGLVSRSVDRECLKVTPGGASPAPTQSRWGDAVDISGPAIRWGELVGVAGAVAAVGFGEVEGAVSECDEVEGVLLGGAAAGGDTDADGYGAVVPRSLAEGFSEAVGDDHGAFGGRVGKDDGEFFAAHAGWDVGVAKELEEAVGEGSQDLIAFGMAVGVVEALEVIGVEEEEGEGPVVAIGEAHGFVEAFVEGAAVVETGELIGDREFEEGLAAGAKFFFDGLFFAKGEVQGAELFAEFELRHDLAGKDAKGLDLGVAEFARSAVDDAEGAEVEAFGIGEREAGVKADIGIAYDEWIVCETRVLFGVGHDECVVLIDGVGAEGDFAGGFAGAGVEAEAGFEPLAMLVDQGDGADGGTADEAGEAGEFVECFFAGGVEDFVLVEGAEAVGFVLGDGGRSCS
jgi:hypothetical protein